MSRQERLSTLADFVVENGAVRVEDVVRELGISPATARRGLRQALGGLAAIGLVGWLTLHHLDEPGAPQLDSPAPASAPQVPPYLQSNLQKSTCYRASSWWWHASKSNPPNTPALPR